MDIVEIRDLRDKLEHRIRAVAAEAVEEFQKKSGLQISGVSVELVTMEVIGYRPEARVTSVKFHIDF